MAPELRETHLLVYYIVKNMIQDTYVQTDEAVHRAKSGRILSPGASILVKLGHTTLWAQRCVHQPGNSPNPILLGFLWRLHYVGMIDH